MEKQKSNSGKRGSITKKLLRIIIPLMAVLVSIIIVISFINMKSTMTKSTYSQLEEESNYNVKVIESWKESLLASLNAVQSTLVSVPFASDEEELDYLKTTMNLNKSFPNGVYEGDANETLLVGSGFVPDADYVVTERDWYKEGVKNDTFAFGAPYKDAETGSFIVSATVLLDRAGTNKRVAATDIFLDDITDMVSDITVMDAKSGYAFLVDYSTNTILAHKDSSLNATEITTSDNDKFMAEVAGLTQADSFKIYTINKDRTPYFVAIQPVEGTSWVLVSAVSQKEVFAALNRLQLLYIILAVVSILVAALLISVVVSKTIAPIKGLTEGIARITEGDFTVRIAPQGNDEITVMSKALKEYIQNMSNVITDIRNVSSQLDEKAEISQNTSKNLSITAGDQAQSMRDMQSTIDQLANAVTELAQNATTLAQVVDAANNDGNEANGKMQGTVTIADQGYKDMQAVQTNMVQIVNAIKELSKVVESVGTSTEEINGIVKLIGDIADQTNLLSLNASIEAARAGDAGRGFAVVADEIGNLADVSAKSVQQISEIITNVNGQVNDMVDRTRESVATIEDNSGAIDTACETFNHIFEDITQTSEIISSMMTQIQQVNDVASNMAAISEEQSASAEEISATIETLTSNSDEVASESTEVEECANVVSEAAATLNEHMSKFSVEE